MIQFDNISTLYLMMTIAWSPLVSATYSELLIGNGFLKIHWFNFFKSDNNMNVPLCFGQIKVRAPDSDIFSSFNAPSLKSSPLPN